MASDTNIKTVEKYPDAIKAAPDSFCVILENEKIRVLELVMKPGTKLAMHSHPASFMYSFENAQFKEMYPDGRTEEKTLKKGQAIWQEPIVHGGENTGKALLHLLIVEMKKV